MKRIISRVLLTAVITMTMMLAGAISSFAAAPAIEDIEYKSNGRVEVEFYGKVKYNKAKVSVKDNSGKKYKVTSIKKDDDDINFTIKNFKPGKTYKITISGVKTRTSKKFGKVTGNIKVPAAKKSAKKKIPVAPKTPVTPKTPVAPMAPETIVAAPSTNNNVAFNTAAVATINTIDAAAAIKIAQDHAAKTWGAGRFWKVEVESDREYGQAVWEVEFNGTINNMPFEFDYDIAMNGGKILQAKHEFDD